MNTAVTEIVFFLLFIGTVLATLPDIPWGPLLGVALGTNAIVPIWFYPRSKTVWVAIDQHFHPG